MAITIRRTSSSGSGGSTGSNGAAAPTSSTLTSYIDASGNNQPDGDSFPHPVIFNPIRITWTNRSGTITTGGTSQQVMAANAARKALIFINTSDTIMYLEFTSAATTTSMPIAANGGNYIPSGPTISTEVINVLCATTGKTFYAKEG